MIERTLWFSSLTDRSYGHSDATRSSAEHANLIGSEVSEGLHAPAIDIDFEAILVPSRTPGHHHLYLERVITWHQYRILLEALMAAGLIERGWYNGAMQQQCSFLRIPPIANHLLPKRLETLATELKGN